MSHPNAPYTPIPPAAPEAAAALSAERLAEIRALQAVWTEYAAQKPWRAASNTPHLATSYAGELLQEVDRLTAALAAAEARAGGFRQQLVVQAGPATCRCGCNPCQCDGQ